MPAFLYYAFVYYFPLAQSISFSFYKKATHVNAKFVGLSLYRKTLEDPLFWLSLKNTFYFVTLSILFTVVLALLIAILLNSLSSHKVRTGFAVLFFSPLTMSLVATALIWGWLYHPQYGLLNYIFSKVGLPSQKWLFSSSQVIPSLAIMQIWLRTGFAVIILLSGLQSIPHEYYEAAAIDGARGLKSFRHITLPLLNPHIVLVCIIELIFDIKVFDLVYASTRGGPINSSRTIVFHFYEIAFGWYEFGKASVLAILIFSLLVGMSFILWRFARKR